MAFDKVIVDAEALKRFREATGQLEVCDSQGRTLGYFMPPYMFHACEELGYAWAREQFADQSGPEYPDDDEPSMTTDEVLGHIEQVVRSRAKPPSEDAA